MMSLDDIISQKSLVGRVPVSRLKMHVCLLSNEIDLSVPEITTKLLT